LEPPLAYRLSFCVCVKCLCACVCEVFVCVCGENVVCVCVCVMYPVFVKRLEVAVFWAILVR
jgi:hypothetical protein